MAVNQLFPSSNTSFITSDRVLPHNLDAERAVLGAMIYDNKTIDEIVTILDRTCFYHSGHTEIFDAIQTLYETNRAVDLITLTEELTRRGRLESVGGAYYLTNLLENIATTGNISHHALIIREKATARSLILAASQILQQGFASDKDVSELVEDAEQLIFNIAQQKEQRGFISLEDLIHSGLETVEKLYRDKGGISGLASGFDDFDKLTSGFQPADFIIIAGRPSMGKTALALNVAQYVSIKKEVPVAIFSLEMAKEQLVLRMLSSIARVEMRSIRGGLLGERQFGQLSAAASELAQAKIYIDDTPSLSALELRAKARRLKLKEPGLGLIMVDYLQLMTAKSGKESRQVEVSEISRSLKALARELRIPVIAVSQLSRAPEKRGESRRPQLADLRESGAIEQDADLVAFVYRPAYYRRMDNKPVRPEDEHAEIIIGKQRNGPCGTVKLSFIEHYMQFGNYAGTDMGPPPPETYQKDNEDE